MQRRYQASQNRAVSPEHVERIVIYLGCYLAIGSCTRIAPLNYDWTANGFGLPPWWYAARHRRRTVREKIVEDLLPGIGGALLIVVAWPIGLFLHVREKLPKGATIVGMMGPALWSRLRFSPIKTFVDGLDHLYGLDIIASMVEKAPEPLEVFVGRYGLPLFSKTFKDMTIHMWAWEGQKFGRGHDLAFGNLYLADVGEHRLTFRRDMSRLTAID